MAQGPPPLSRQQLERVLGLETGSSEESILRAAARLMTGLEARRVDAADASESAALASEIEALSASLIATLSRTPDAPAAPSAASNAALSSRFARERLLMAMIATLSIALLLLFMSWLGRGATQEESRDARIAIEPAKLIVESRPADAELRIVATESEELLLRIPGNGVRVELPPGRYAIEVSRPDCPDSWLREIELEAAETRRYEPTICRGAGEVVVRSNVVGDRLRIDDIDLGGTRPEPHLLGVGDHAVRVEKPGHSTYEGEIRVRPDERIDLFAELVPLDGRPAAPVASASAPKPAAAPLPFERVTPSAPPVAGDPSRGLAGRPDARPPLPRTLLPEPLRPERVAIPKPALDFDSPTRLAHMGKGGSTTWHDAMTSRFLSKFDADGSGQIDRSSETEAIPCTFWKQTERSFDEGGLGLSMSRLYGFDGSEWHPRALGFAREQRGLAYQQMKLCGLAP